MTGASAAGLEAAARAKHAVRDRVWALLEREQTARFPGANGRIPNFAGASAAAAQLASLPPWRAAGVVKANPDAPQLPVRARALAEGKLLYMAVPRLADERPSSCSIRDSSISHPAAPPPSAVRPAPGGGSPWPTCGPWTWWCAAAWPSTVRALRWARAVASRTWSFQSSEQRPVSSRALFRMASAVAVPVQARR